VEAGLQRFILNGDAVATVVGLLKRDRWGVAEAAVQPVLLLNQCTHDRVASSRSSTLRNGPS